MIKSKICVNAFVKTELVFDKLKHMTILPHVKWNKGSESF